MSGASGPDTIEGIEHAEGSVHNDTLIGDAANNILGGLEGDDQIEGGDGDDRLSGHSGVDSLDGGSGMDTCEGETVVNCEAPAARMTLRFARARAVR